MIKNNIQLIVDRYNENLDWLFILNNIDIIIYNKGINDIDYIKQICNNSNYNSNCDIIHLDNIGKEKHTFIINNYHNLYSYNFFVQAFPFNHSPNIYSKINSYKLDFKDIHFEFINDKNILKCDF
jgi:hypothetical protein